MKRTTKNPSKIFRQVLDQAEEELTLNFRAATAFEHRGIRGEERAAALQKFLREHLPAVFGVGKGEAVDYRDIRTGELDLCVYDRIGAAPIQSGDANTLIPAEALYAVIEVKSILTQQELNKCLKAAAKVRRLRPFKREFTASPILGGESKGTRCLYMVFAYSTNLSEDDWAQKEFDRLKLAMGTANGSIDLIDRLIVLDRGIIRPQVGYAKVREPAEGIFLDFYIHLIAYLTRERKRRSPIDWLAYTSRSTWVHLK